MARNSNFDEARRKLDEALQQLGGPEAPGLPADPPQTGAARPATGAAPARVAPRRRSRAAPMQAAVRPTPAPPPAAGPPPSPAGLAMPATEQGPAGVGGEAAGPQAPAEAKPGITGPHRPPEPAAAAAGPPATEALARLMVGAALLGLDGLAAHADGWEAAAGMPPRRPAATATEGEIGSGRFRHALIGWVFEAEEQLRPRGNPIRWLREVVRYLFGTVFAVVIDLLPLPRLGSRRARGAPAEPTDEETLRWARRGQAEEERSRRFARAAIADLVDRAIVYLARRPGLGQALGELVRSPAMDDAIARIVDGPAVERAIARVAQSPALDDVVASVANSPAIDQAIARVAQSPALDQAIARVAQSPALDDVVVSVANSPAIDQAVTTIVRSPAMEDAVKYLVGTRAMGEAIDTLSKSPALVDLVTTQSTSVAAEILEEVREHAVSADRFVEAFVRRLLRRRPRPAMPLEAQGLLLASVERQPPTSAGGPYVQ